LPTLETMGVSPLWFGVFVVLLGEFGMITPPVGIIPYIVHSIAKNPELNLGHTVTLRDIFISLRWFLPVAVVFLVLMIAAPEMREWLPALIERTSGGMAAGCPSPRRPHPIVDPAEPGLAHGVSGVMVSVTSFGSMIEGNSQPSFKGVS